MKSEEKKINSILVFAIIFIFVFVAALIFFSTGEKNNSNISTGGLTVNFGGNKSLKSDNYFNFNISIKNNYDIDLKELNIWLESGSLFAFMNSSLRTSTNIFIEELRKNSTITYFIPNIKTEKVYSEMKSVPIYVNILYKLVLDIPLIITVSRNDTLELYGGLSNMGVKYQKKKSPLLFYLKFSNTDFVFKGNNSASFELEIKNSKIGNCSNITIQIISNPNLSCKILNSTYKGNFKVEVPFKDLIKLSCIYDIGYLERKDFDTQNFSLVISCKYLERKTIYFNILP
ncbi:MAG: hypothetical protein QXD89_00370 [Candidatus Aenigmatarchaeota archaeon]